MGELFDEINLECYILEEKKSEANTRNRLVQ